MVGTNSPHIDAYSKVLQVFFALYSKVPEGASARLYSEALLTPSGSLWGYRYIFLMDGQNVLSELDGFGHNEIILHWANAKGNPDKARYFKTHGQTFGEQWMAFFGGVREWRRSCFVVFPDVDPEDSYAHLASSVFAFGKAFGLGSGVCAQQNDPQSYYDQQTQAFKFPKPQYVFPFRCIHELGDIKFPHVLEKELAVTRVSVGTVLSLAMEMARGPVGPVAAQQAAQPPPAQRPRLDSAAANSSARVPMPKAPADVHRFLPLAELAQSIKAVRAATEKIEDPKARYILNTFCDSKMGDAYLHALRTSSMRSPGDIAMMDYATQTVNGVPTTSCYWHRRWLPVYHAMSSSEALISKCLAALEAIFSVDMCHHEALMLLFGAPDCFRLAFETMKFSAWIFSKGGGVSKSFMLNLVKAMSVPGMIKLIGRFTAAAFAVNGTEENPTCPNQTMQVIGIDDTDPDLFSEAPKNTLMQAALKTAMTSEKASVDTLKITDTGDRIKKFIEAPLGGVFIVLANVAKIAHQPFERRAHAIQASEVGSTTIDETVIQSWEAGLDSAQLSISTEVRWLQYCQYMISQLQYCGLLPEFTYGAAGVILMELSKGLKSDSDIKTFTRIDTSALQRVKSYARLVEINKICMDAFCAVGADGGREYRAIGVAEFLRLAPRMYISVESICNAAMFLIDGWLPSLRFVVGDALRLFVASKAAGGIAAKELVVRNKTTLFFQFGEVVRFIVAIAPTLTRNFTPNYDTVASHLRAFLSLPAEDSPCYVPAPDLAGKVVEEANSQTVKVVPLVETKTGTLTSELEISIYHFRELLVYSHPKEYFLGAHVMPAGMELHAQEAADVLVFQHELRKQSCADAPCADCLIKKAATGAEDMTKAVAAGISLAAKDPSLKDTPEARRAFAASFLWDAAKSAEGMTLGDMFRHVAGTWDAAFARIWLHFKRKMDVYLRTHFRTDFGARRWERVPDAPSIQWLETTRSVATEVAARGESEYSSLAYEKVAKVFAAMLDNKNQLPRRIFAGPDPHVKYCAKFVEVGGGQYDPSQHVTVRLKNRDLPQLGEYALGELANLLGDLKRIEIKVNYDLDTWTQERHFEANGIDPSVTISDKLLADLSDLLTTTSDRWDGYFLNGVEAKKLAPVNFTELPEIAQKIKQRMARGPAAGEDDIFFPREETERKVALAKASNIDPRVFHLQDYRGSCKTMCFAPLRFRREEEGLIEMD
jgi:hypothetical protein